MAARRSQRRSRIEANKRRAHNERICPGAFIQRKVAHHQKVGLDQRMLTNRAVEIGLAFGKSEASLEPLPVVRNEADQRNRCVANIRCQFDDIVKAALRRRVENGKLGERL